MISKNASFIGGSFLFIYVVIYNYSNVNNKVNVRRTLYVCLKLSKNAHF